MARLHPFVRSSLFFPVCLFRFPSSFSLSNNLLSNAVTARAF